MAKKKLDKKVKVEICPKVCENGSCQPANDFKAKLKAQKDKKNV